MLGILKAQTQQWQAAEGHLRKAVQLQPADAESWDNLGVVLLRLGRRGEARQCFEKSLSRDPTRVQASLNLGSLLLADGDARQAFTLAEDVLRRNPALSQALALRDKSAAALRSGSARR
jgi:Flp pilus assembly protein TadD